jgi:putative membrane protein
MSRIIIAWLITTIAILLAAYLVPGIRIASAGAAIIGAAILAILNALLKPILVVLTFPLTIVTLGLFLLVINALMFLLAGSLVKGFEVRSFGSALLGSLIVSIVSFVAH